MRFVGTATSIAVVIGATPLPFADAAVLLPLQSLMLTAIAYVSGGGRWDRPGGERLARTLGLNVGAALGMRELVRAVLKVVPGVGGPLSGAVAGRAPGCLGSRRCVTSSRAPRRRSRARPSTRRCARGPTSCCAARGSVGRGRRLRADAGRLEALATPPRRRRRARDPRSRGCGSARRARGGAAGRDGAQGRGQEQPDALLGASARRWTRARHHPVGHGVGGAVSARGALDRRAGGARRGGARGGARAHAVDPGATLLVVGATEVETGGETSRGWRASFRRGRGAAARWWWR